MTKTKLNIIRLIVWILVFLFFVLYFMQASGYNEYTRNRENMLSEEQIREYEEDIKEGKDVTIKDYLNKDKVNYAFFNMLNEAVSS